MPTTAPLTISYLLVIEDKTPDIVAEFTDWREATAEQARLEAARIAAGIPISQKYYAVRQEDDAQDLVKIALARREAAAKPKRQQTRMVEGIKLISQGDGFWRSEDGRFEIERDDGFEFDCEDPHPVKISPQMRKDIEARPQHWCSEARWAVQEGRRGYQCPGGRAHLYTQWVTAGPLGTPSEDVIARDDTFGNAVKSLSYFLRTGKRSA